MKVTEFFKLVEAKAAELRDVINAMFTLWCAERTPEILPRARHGHAKTALLQLQTQGVVLTTEDVLKRPSLTGTSIDWELRTDKRRHIAALYAEYSLLSAELSHMLSVEVEVPDYPSTSPKYSPPTTDARISPSTPR